MCSWDIDHCKAPLSTPRLRPQDISLLIALSVVHILPLLCALLTQRKGCNLFELRRLKAHFKGPLYSNQQNNMNVFSWVIFSLHRLTTILCRISKRHENNRCSSCDLSGQANFSVFVTWLEIGSHSVARQFPVDCLLICYSVSASLSLRCDRRGAAVRCSDQATTFMGQVNM